MNDLLGGQISMMFTDIPTAIPHIKAGKLKALGVTSAQPSQALPDVLPIAQQGLAGFDLKAWYGVLAPAGTPKPVIDRLNAEITKALNSPELKEKLLSMGMEPIALDPAQSASYMKTEIDRWANVVKISGAKIDWRSGAWARTLQTRIGFDVPDTTQTLRPEENIVVVDYAVTAGTGFDKPAPHLAIATGL
jgi:hypothetical protein